MNRNVLNKIEDIIEEAFEVIDVKDTPMMPDGLAAKRSVFHLKLEIDARDQYIAKLRKTLNNPEELKVIMRDKTKLKKLTTEFKKAKIDKLPKNVVVPAEKNLGDGMGINQKILAKYINIDNLEFVGKGISSIIFKHPTKSKKVLGITIDPHKIKWLDANSDSFKFNLLHSFIYDKGNKAYIFEMKKFDKFFSDRKMSAENMNLVFSDVIHPFLKLQSRKGFANVTVKDLDWIMEPIADKQLLSILQNLKKTFSNGEILDLHGGQWAEDETGKIVLFDPIIDKRIFNRLGSPGELDLSIKMKQFLKDIFKNPKDQEKILKKVLKNE